MNDYVAYISGGSIGSSLLPEWHVTVHDLNIPAVTVVEGLLERIDVSALHAWFCAHGFRVTEELLPGLAYGLAR